VVLVPGDAEPFLGLPAGTICCFVSAVSHSTLICGTSPGLLLPLGVLLSEPGAFGKCLGCPAER